MSQHAGTPGAQRGTTFARALTIDVTGRHERFPLTDMQQAYWIGRNDGFEMGNVTCHLYIEVDIAALDVARMEHAWNGLVRRHDMLRAVIHPDGQQQVLAEVPRYRIQQTDLRALAPPERTRTLGETRARLSHQVFDPDRWPLFELHALLLPRRDRLCLSIDGLLADGWSAMLLFQELERRYLHPDEPSAPLDVTFRDYVLSTSGAGTSPASARALEYWRRRAQTLPPAPALPLATDPGAIRRPVFARSAAELPAGSWGSLSRHARDIRISPVAALIAAYAEVLRTFSASPCFTLNIPRFNRLPLHPQVREVIGNFSSFNLLEAGAEPRESFATRARRLNRQLLEDLSHDEMTGIAVLREMARAQGLGARAAMPIVFTSLLNMGTRTGRFLVNELGEVNYLVSQTPQVWLDCQVYEQDGALQIAWDAVEALFPADLVGEMLSAYVRLLGRLGDDRAAWDDVPVLIPPAQADARARINATGELQPGPRLDELFAVRAAQAPDATAVIDGAVRLSYGELDAITGALSSILRSRGVGRDALVAVAMRKGWEQVAGALAVVRAGGAYLPVDPDMPAERVQYLLANGEVRVLLTQPGLVCGAWPAGVETIAVERSIAATAPANVQPAPPPDEHDDGALAYVIYTSGSTGDPKGVMVEHRSAVNAVLVANERCGVGPADRVIALTALHHDLSVYDVFGPLAAGAAIVVPSPDHVRDPSHWLQLLAEEAVTVWNTVPAMMEMLVEYAEGQRRAVPACLRAVILGGDWIPVSLPDRLRRLVPGVRVNSIGGPTETTIWNIWHPIDEVLPDWKSIPYGRPIRGNRYHVLNADLEECPDWVQGELYCAGGGLARGYWRDPERTAARFITHPRTGERLYATGDLGRFLPDGNIEFLGRRDFQVKLRGQRIELGGIESTLLKHPAVGAAAAVVAGSGAARRLAAFVVLKPSEAAPVHDERKEAAGATVTDPLERTRFKLAQHGLRADANLARVALAPPSRAEVHARRSVRTFSREPVPLGPLTELLGALRETERDGLPHYFYPSAGGLYPVQAYLYAAPGRVSGVSGGLYYYHPVAHELRAVAPGALIPAAAHWSHNRPIGEQAAFALLLVARMSAITPMYGELARDFALIEAGCVVQLLMTEAADVGLGLCPVGSLDSGSLRSQLALREDDVLVHSLWGGLPATVQAEAPAPLAPQSLRAFLAGRLPAHEVPASITLLTALPMTANQKIDRRALGEMAEAAQPVVTPPAAPLGTKMEETILRAWDDVLPGVRIETQTNFFDQGINSLTVVRVYNRLRETLDREFPVVSMFRYPTIRALAAFLGEAGPVSQASSAGAERGSMRRRATRGHVHPPAQPSVRKAHGSEK